MVFEIDTFVFLGVDSCIRLEYNNGIPNKKGGWQMVNLPKLRAKLAEKGIKVNDLVEIWGCTRACASKKVNGRSKIRLDEAQRFSDYAHLTDEEKVEIFFS